MSRENLKAWMNIIIVIVVGAVIFFLLRFTIFDEKVHKQASTKNFDNGDETVSSGSFDIPEPDRIIYKNSEKKCFVIESGDTYFYSLYSKLKDKAQNKIDGKTYTEDEITQMQQNGRFIELDYNRISKNYIFFLDEDEIGIMRRTETGGQVLQVKISGKTSLIGLFDQDTQRSTKVYDLYAKSYTSENKLQNLGNYGFIETSTANVYKKIIENDFQGYTDFMKEINFSATGINGNPPVDFIRQNVLVLATARHINDFDVNIGNMRFELGEFLGGEYEINVFYVSKLININCLYFDTESGNEGDDSSIIYDASSQSTGTNGLSYSIESGKYYATLDGKKTEIISVEEAAKIAEEEAQKDKYQYQGWESKFSVMISDNETVRDSGRLILGLDEISRLYYWNSDWKVSDYEGKAMWMITLVDENDPLTDLFIYVDATNGQIVGAGSMSD